MLNPDQVNIIYFDVTKEECIQRTKRRALEGKHESGDLFLWGGATAIASHAKKLEIPTNGDQCGQVYTISNNDDFKRLIYKFGGIFTPLPSSATDIKQDVKIQQNLGSSISVWKQQSGQHFSRGNFWL